MDFERGIEFTTKETKNEGYSEEEQAKAIEGSVIDRKRPGSKRKPIQTISRKDKIVNVYQSNMGKILDLIRSIYELNSVNLRQEEQILEEIKRLHRLQEEILSALILEQKGLLNSLSISKEAWDLIQ